MLIRKDRRTTPMRTSMSLSAMPSMPRCGSLRTMFGACGVTLNPIRLRMRTRRLASGFDADPHPTYDPAQCALAGSPLSVQGREGVDQHPIVHGAVMKLAFEFGHGRWLAVPSQLE